MKVWFITGTSRGLGREFAITALQRGDLVAAAARDTDTLADLVETYGDAILPIRLDVTDRSAAFAAVDRAHHHFGRLDIVVNNAGYGQYGFAEELSETELRAQMDTNFFGAVWVTQAALPHLRAQRGGHIIQVSSIGGVTAFPNLGGYHASKWALEGFTQSLAQEVSPFGIRVTLIEPGGFSTDWVDSAHQATRHPDYRDEHRKFQRARTRRMAGMGQPEAAGSALLRLVDSADPPLRVFFGKSPLSVATADYTSRLATWQRWQPLAVAAQG
ncbi:MAG: SDR family oxidoreductase [Mycobacterium sp.]